jgi:hypothetical protein
VKLGYGRVVSEENVYYLGHLAAKATFPKDANKLFTDPSKLPPPQPGPDYDMLKLELAKYKTDMGDAQKRDKMAIDAQLEQMRQALEAGKTQFQAMVDKVNQERQHQQDVMKLVIEQEQQNRQRVVDAMAQMQIAKEQGANDQQQTVLQGVIDSLKEQQVHQHRQMEQLLKGAQEAAMVEKEIVRDEKGKATGVRPKKK